MRSREEVRSLLMNPGVIAVVRVRSRKDVLAASEALLAGGIHAIEITMTTPNAVEAIREACAAFGSSALIGVGTVLSGAVAREAIDAGAEFVVSPILKREVLEAAHEAGRPGMLGAYTPTEAQTAYELGSDFIKLFPADGLGPAYVKALRAPLPHLRIVPTGGVDEQTIGPFFKAGCAAVGVGSSLLSGRILESGDWAGLTRAAAKLVELARAARAQE